MLTLLVLMATTSISASTHYCGKYLVSFELNKTSKNCFTKFKSKKENRSRFKVTKKSCCKDLSILKKASNDILKTKATVLLKKGQLSSNIVFTSPNFFKTSYLTLIDAHSISVDQYKKIQISEDKTVLFQVFLI